jgi:uncharacterized protein YhjY with autotransporter beta-barrel domain
MAHGFAGKALRRAAMLLVLAGATVHEAQAQPGPRTRPATEDCADPLSAECIARRKAEQEAAAAPRPGDAGAGGVAAGAAIIPCFGDANGGVCGEPFPRPVPQRGPLTVRRFDLSVGVDHLLSRQWAVGGLVGVGRARVQRLQTGEAVPKDTTVRSRSSTLAATLSWFPTPDAVVEATLATQRTSFDFERTDRSSSGSRTFFGENSGRSHGLLLHAANAWRRGAVTLVPQLGLEHMQSRIDPLDASIANPPPGSVENFQVTAQKTTTLSGVAGLQAQWPRSVSFGTVTPFARAAWRQRLSQRSDPVVADGPGPLPREIDLNAESVQYAATLAGGALVYLTGGTSLYAELGLSRGDQKLRETRLSVGIKFER